MAKVKFASGPIGKEQALQISEASIGQSLAHLIELLTEYTDKLVRWNEEYARLTEAKRVDSLGQLHLRFRQFLPTAKKLAQFASQRLTWSTDPLVNLELELRLVEFEAAYLFAMKLVEKS